MTTTGKEFHLVRAAFLKPFTETMRANGVDAAKYYRKVKLPAVEPEEPESLLPEKPFWRLVNIVARNENIPDFGAQVATAFPWHSVESLGPLISQCDTLGELLVTFCQNASGQSSQVQFDLKSHRGSRWFIASGTPLIRKDTQMEFYRVTCMIQLIQLATGSGWRPKNVMLFMPIQDTTHSCSLIDQSAVAFSCGQTAIEIPHVALKLPVKLSIPNTRMDLSKYDIDASFIDSLKIILQIYIAHGEYKIESIATVIGIPVRTLQRRLGDLGTSFNELLGKTRFELGKILLKGKTPSISKISAELGYSDDAHFVRAFKRWAGMTPGEFRKTSDR